MNDRRGLVIAGCTVILIILVAFMLNATAPTTTTTTTTAPTTTSTVASADDARNDRLVSPDERAAIPALAQVTPTDLTTLTSVVCGAVESSTDRASAFASVHTRLVRNRPGMTAGTATRLTDVVARVACLDAYEALK